MKRVDIAAILIGSILLFANAGAQVNGKSSDAIILIYPMGKGASVSVTYPAVMSHSSVKQSIARLGRMAGWTIASVDVKDEEITSRSSSGKLTSLGKQTGALIMAPNAPIVRDGGFVLQPFVQAFSDLRRIEILFFVQKQPDFRGLKEFESRPLSVKLVSDGGPYRYAIDIKEAGVPLPNLPLTQATTVGNVQNLTPVVDTSTARRSADFAFVLMVATGCALIVLVMLLVIFRFRMGNSPAPGSRRAH